jgi:integrase
LAVWLLAAGRRFMARLYKPTYTRAIPPHAVPVTITRNKKKVKCVRWTQRGGRIVTAPLAADGTRCLVEVDCWWVEYRDHTGKRCFEECFKDRRASEQKKLDIETRVERVQSGNLPPSTLAIVSQTIADLLDEWEAHLINKGRSSSYVTQMTERVARAVAEMGASRPGDITATKVEKYLARLRAEGRDYRQKESGSSVQTSNHYLAHLKQFTRWLANPSRNYLDRDPLAGLERLNADVARAYERRALTDDEFWTLIETTARSAKVWRRTPGPDRAMCYLTAAFTGLRLGELAKLTPRSFVDRGDQFAILLPGREQKNRKELPVYLPSAVAARLRPYLAAKPPDEPLWDRGTWAKNNQASFALYQDLAAANILIVDAAGKRFDFHALRSHYITWLLVKGVPLPHAQKLARLSTPTILMKHYAKLGLDDLACQVEKLNPPVFGT